MGLVDIWEKNKADLGQKQLKQVIALAGDGRLLDDSLASEELRQLLRILPSGKLGEYAHQCLDEAFESSGLALQDIVNEIGRRLGFVVEDGRYRGTKGVSGHDGLWALKNGKKIIVEVKTTDAYSIDLDVFLSYRRLLLSDTKTALDEMSILIVVGRKNTSSLEAQIRGSRLAWDIRVISVDSLLRLMKLKETLDDPITALRISEILLPKEYTRVDEIIDLVFMTAEEVSAEDEPDVSIEHPQKSTAKMHPEKTEIGATPVNFHDLCASRIEESFSISLVRESRAIYADPKNGRRFLILVSKHHGNGTYWFAIHPHQKDALEEMAGSYVVLGCGSEKYLLVVPVAEITSNLDKTWTTEREDRMYWHIRLKTSNGGLVWNLRKGVSDFSLEKFLLPK